MNCGKSARKLPLHYLPLPRKVTARKMPNISTGKKNCAVSTGASITYKNACHHSLCPSNQDQVFLGAWVTLEKEDGEEICYRIVGADEIDAKKNYISLDSPLARALLKKTFQDEVQIKNGDNPVVCYTIVDIDYEQPA